MIFKIGDVFKANFIVSDEIYNGFINLFKDKNPIHTEENYFILFSLPTYHLTNSTNILNLKNYTLIVPIFSPITSHFLPDQTLVVGQW